MDHRAMAATADNSTTPVEAARPAAPEACVFVGGAEPCPDGSVVAGAGAGPVVSGSTGAGLEGNGSTGAGAATATARHDGAAR
jgi:hypothetical protein